MPVFAKIYGRLVNLDTVLRFEPVIRPHGIEKPAVDIIHTNGEETFLGLNCSRQGCTVEDIMEILADERNIVRIPDADNQPSEPTESFEPG